MSLEAVYERNNHHRGQSSGWLRAAVLGANDGLVSNASLLIGLAAAGKSDLLRIAGLAGVAAGAMSMAVGEYISVRSQVDIEEADRAMEIEHLAIDPEGELLELTQIYIDRGLPQELASQVARTFTEKNALEAHLRDELGHHEINAAKPFQAALASAISFSTGALIPLLGALLPTTSGKVISIVIFALLGLGATGVISSRLAGSALLKTTLRVLLGGVIGMGVTAGIGSIIHA